MQCVILSAQHIVMLRYILLSQNTQHDNVLGVSKDGNIEPSLFIKPLRNFVSCRDLCTSFVFMFFGLG